HAPARHLRSCGRSGTAPRSRVWRHRRRRSALEPSQPRALVPHLHRQAGRSDAFRTLGGGALPARRRERRIIPAPVFGLGYEGWVSAAAFADDGHTVVGVDVNPGKVAAVNAGRSPIVEPGLDELLARATAEGRLQATPDTAAAVRDTEVSLLCVGTP